MIAGEKTIFGIEWLLHEPCHDDWLLGYMQIWIGDRPIGDIERCFPLRDFLMVLTSRARDAGKRDHRELFALPKDVVFRRLASTLYSVPNDVDFTDVANEEGWARFDISMGVPSTDGNLLFLIECDDDARVIHGQFPYNASLLVTDFHLRRGYVDSVLIETHEAIDQLYEHACLASKQSCEYI